MTHIEKSIEVDVPIRTAYNQWTQFEEFPSFMKGVRSVRQLDVKRLQWEAEVGGRDIQWTAEITHQEPDRHIGWRSTSGATNAGSVKFEPIDAGKTRVILRMDYDPDGVLEKTGSAIGVVSGRVEGDLKRFKRFIEERGSETGAWRGEIRQGHVGREGAAGSSLSEPHIGAVGASHGPGGPGDAPELRDTR
jgi:uncharacterized membrane protein